MLGIQIVGILFGLFMIYLTFLHQKRKEFTTKEFGFWLILWIAFVFVALLPSSLDFFVEEIINLQRPLDFFIIAGFLFLIGASFYTYTLVRVNQKRLEEIVRKIAMEKPLFLKKGK